MAARVLVVDDDEDIRVVVGLLLEEQGYEVETAVDGLDALERVKAGPRPSVILLDMMMPRMDGEAFMRALRREPDLADIPVVVVSGHAIASEKAAQLSAAACLVKPIELEELLRVVQAFTP